ncbi:Mov34/MPN/PAD-1 family protein [Cytobacillus gottheilii]|uniref:Mov34/MPN/PAD-1 family protein n=1 Tax=Cytobacillus gottheilii TaxID=859144 RepID=UPI0024954085|nr:Mov34/MPN/PAD-1 family protein [Cytobacillus gottheilii]
MTANNDVQTDIFSMFGLIDEVAEKKKREEEEIRKKAAEEKEKQMAEFRQKAQEAAANTKVQAEKTKGEKPEEKFEPNEETVIRFYGESLEITSYFTPEELVEGLLINKKGEDPVRKPLEPEMLRKRMEKDFPELVKSHTEMVFLKEKNIVVPMVKAKKKGCIKEELSIDSSSSLFKGINKIIPFSILRDFIAVARIYEEVDLEVHGDIYYIPTTDSFILDFPEQIVHKYWAEVSESLVSIAERMEDAIKVVEIHSHHKMGAFPSNQDNRSEREPGMVYAIVGKVQEFFPQLFTRIFISENLGHQQINAEQIFEWPFFNLPKEFEPNNIKAGGEHE